jgi:antitoxin VapB
MLRRAKLFRNGRSQAVRLPSEYRFEGPEVYVRRDADTGDIILSRRPESWSDFFELMKTIVRCRRTFSPTVTIRRRRSGSCSDGCPLSARYEHRQLRHQGQHSPVSANGW